MGENFLGKRIIGTVLCPGCKEPMQVRRREPILFSKALTDVTYCCEICGTETKRTMKG